MIRLRSPFLAQDDSFAVLKSGYSCERAQRVESALKNGSITEKKEVVQAFGHQLYLHDKRIISAPIK